MVYDIRNSNLYWEIMDYLNFRFEIWKIVEVEEDEQWFHMQTHSQEGMCISIVHPIQNPIPDSESTHKK